MNRGYICLWRKSLDSVVFKNDGLWKLWTWCLLKASHTEIISYVRTGKAGVESKIYPGQFVFGRESAAKELGCNPSTVWKRINKLKTLGKLNIESNSQYSIISINNWDTYQQEKLKSNSKSNSQVTGKEQASNTDKNDKNEQEIKNSGGNGKFIPPTINEIKEYCQERNNDIDAETFFHHYEANGWVRGKNKTPIVRWKSVVVQWEKLREKDRPKQGRILR